MDRFLWFTVRSRILGRSIDDLRVLREAGG